MKHALNYNFFSNFFHVLDEVDSCCYIGSLVAYWLIVAAMILVLDILFFILANNSI